MTSTEKIVYYHLTEPQKRIFFSELMYDNTSINNLCASYYLKDSIDLQKLVMAINFAVFGNEGIRLRITLKDGQPVQYVAPYKFVNYSINEIDATYINNYSKKKFNFYDSQLFEIIIFYNSDQNFSFILKMHHIISDAWTHSSISTQIYENYESLKKNNKFSNKIKRSYVDFIRIEEEFINSNRYQKNLDYWNSIFLNRDSSNLFIKSNTEAKRCIYYFNSQESQSIENFCINNKISIPNFFLSILSIVANRDKLIENSVIGILTHNRIGNIEKQIAGMFVNTLPFKYDLTLSDNFLHFAENISKQMGTIMRHQRFALKDINNCPSIKIVYTYENIEIPIDIKLHFSGHEFFPMVFRVSRRSGSGGFQTEIDFQSSLFSEDFVNGFFMNYKSKVLEIVCSTDDSNVIIRNQNYNYHQTLHTIFEQNIANFSNKVAVSFFNENLTYYELNNRANYIAHKLIELGAGNEKPVGILLERSFDMMISILAVLKTGSCYLPISPCQPSNRIDRIIELSGASIVLSHSYHGISKKCKNIIQLDNVEYPQNYIPNLDLNISPENLAYIIYTSGSTGEPKGVMVEHKAVVNRLIWMLNEYKIESDDKFIQKTPYTFDVSVWELFLWFFKGSSLHFVTPGGEKDPQIIFDEIIKKDITIIHFVPSMLSVFLDYCKRCFLNRKISSLKEIICSGESLQVNHVRKFTELFNSTPTKINNLYGPTEAAIDVSYYQCQGNEEIFIPIGKAIDNVELYVLNKNGDVLPPGEVGELYIGGVCLARGYFKDEELTNEKFNSNNSLNKRLYKTGDLATFLDDGNIKYLGRVDYQVKIRGNRVELGEIESCLLKYPDIRESVVIAPVDEDGNSYLGAYFVADHTISHSDLRHYLQNELPTYMIPSYFIQMDSFKLTSSGKLDRKMLPMPDNTNKSGKKYHAPVNDREEEICEIWEDVLNIEKIGRDDNFFTDLGGDSIMLIQVHFALQKKYEITLQDLFEYQTIKTLTEHIHSISNIKVKFKNSEYYNILKQRSCFNKVKEYYQMLPDKYSVNGIHIKNILITGGTGFLGSYLIKENLENSNAFINLVVRGENNNHAEERVKESLGFYFGEDFFEKYKSRLAVYCGNIESKKFDLESSVYLNLSLNTDLVIHSAANVKHFGDRNKIYSTNVTGTENIVDFCKSAKTKRLIFLSTMSVGLNGVEPGWNYHFIENDVLSTNNRGNVYVDSKILAEEIVRKELGNIGGQILRLGNIVFDTESGKFQKNSRDNAFRNLIYEYKRAGVVPDIDIPFIDLSYVNETAAAIGCLSRCDFNGVLHLYNPDQIKLKNLFLEDDIEVVDPESFVNALKLTDSILTHGYYLQDISKLGLIQFSEYTVGLLKHLGFSWSKINNKIITLLWDSWETDIVKKPILQL